MRCPKCGSNNTSVSESRPKDNGYSTMRRRKCNDCGSNFKTTELGSIDKKRVKTTESSRGEIFDYNKLLLSIVSADYEGDIPLSKVYEFVYSIILEKKQTFTKEELIEKVASFLKEKNYKVYVRYLCKYKKFVLEENN